MAKGGSPNKNTSKQTAKGNPFVKNGGKGGKAPMANPFVKGGKPC